MEWKTNDASNDFNTQQKQSFNSKSQRSLSKSTEKIATMSNDEISQILFEYICNHETNKFKQCLKAIKLLQNDNEKQQNKISLHYILNEKLCGEFGDPLIVVAAFKNNIEIVETLLCKENDYKVWFFVFFVSLFAFFFVIVWAFLRLFEISFVCFFFFKLVFFPYKMIL